MLNFDIYLTNNNTINKPNCQAVIKVLIFYNVINTIFLAMH